MMESSVGALTLPRLAALAAAILSPAAQSLAIAVLEAICHNPDRARHFLKGAEASSVDEAELSYVLHCEAMILMYLGDMEEASERERRSLEICCRLGHGRLVVDVLSTMSIIYRALGHADLARAYAAEAQRRQSLAEEKG
jgi:hypothetical protein